MIFLKSGAFAILCLALAQAAVVAPGSNIASLTDQQASGNAATAQFIGKYSALAVSEAAAVAARAVRASKELSPNALRGKRSLIGKSDTSRPLINTRGRMLGEVNACKFHEGTCDVSTTAVSGWKPKTDGGKKFKDNVITPQDKCEAITTQTACVGDAQCSWETEEDGASSKCDVNFPAALASFDSSTCAESAKKAPTILEWSTQMALVCSPLSDKTQCKANADCEYDDQGSSCGPNSQKLLTGIMGGITNSTKGFMNIGLKVEECGNGFKALGSGATAANCSALSSGTCAYSTDDKACEASTAYTFSQLGDDGAKIMTSMLTCMLSPYDKCPNSTCIQANNQCSAKADVLANMIFASSADGPVKDLMVGSMACEMHPVSNTTKCSDMSQYCTKSKVEDKCEYENPGASAALMSAPAPGAEKVCPSAMATVMSTMMACQGLQKDACDKNDNCNSGAEGCEPKGGLSMFAALVPAEDMKTINDLSTACDGKTTKAACEGTKVTMETAESTSAAAPLAAVAATVLGAAMLL